MISCVGDVTADRDRQYCPTCRRNWVPLDAWAGLGSDHLTPRGRRLVVLAGTDHSFDIASDRLHRMCGVRVSDQTVRRACEGAGQRAQAYLESESQAVSKVREAKGQVEVLMDGAKVNTVAGWREIRGILVCKREAGKPADLRHWDDRVLPEPSAAWACARIASAEQMGKHVDQAATRLNLGQGEGVSALADGAPWIWNQFKRHLPDHEGVLDVYHLLEHLHAAGRALHGEGADAQQWAEQQRAALFRDGPHRYLHQHLLPMLKHQRQREGGAGRAKALRALFVYLWPHRGRMHYRDRLRRGLPIGSGQVEGLCKNTLNARLRRNNARWRPEHAETMAALCCLHRSNQWDAFWPHAYRQAA